MNRYDDDWNLVDGAYNPDLGKYYEGLFTQGNGYIHVRGSYDEGLIDSCQAKDQIRRPANVTLEKHEKEKTRWGTYIPGIVGQHPFLKTEIINLPYIFEFRILVDGKQLDMDESPITGYLRRLSMKDSSLYRSFEYQGDGVKLGFAFSRFISKKEKHVAIQKIEITGIEGSAKIDFSAGINTGVRTNGFEHFVERKLFADEKLASAVIKTNGGNTVAMCSGVSVADCDVSGETDDIRAAQKGSITVAKGQTVVIEKRIAFATDRDLNESGEPLERAVYYLNRALEKSYEDLYIEQVCCWNQEWNIADVKVKGNPKVQKAVRMSVYHLLRCKPYEDPRIAICAKGYAGEAYFGRYFWDTEMSMLPFFLHTDAKAARNLVQFRYETLEGAKRNAISYGYEGARYAWESAVTGDEECPNWQYCDHEVHVTADIIYAMMHYVKATGDRALLREFGAEIMVETARYWVKRVDWDKDGVCHLLGVMGPDEYLPMTADNTYTNNMVIYSLKETLRTLEWLQLEYPCEYEELIAKLSLLESEVTEFARVADALVKGYDQDSEIILQSADFMNYADVDFDAIWTDRSKPFGQFISQERNYRSKALKQADLLELMMLFPDEFSEEQLKANYDYYEPITTHDSSLSAAVHGILCAKMGRSDEAMNFMEKVMEIDLNPDKKGAEEGIHIANCGGIWQLLIYGFAGVKSAMSGNGELVVEPHLPKGIDGLEFNILWQGELKSICV